MKKIAFMFVAAALFAACGQKQAPAQEAEVAEVEEAVVEEVIDSAAAWELVGDTVGMPADTIAVKFAAAVDTLKARAAAVVEEAPVAEETPAE